MKHFFNILMPLACLPLLATAQSGALIEKLEALSGQPQEIIIKNSWEINNQGGHLQGIQMMRHDGSDYFVVTGSSSDYSYYVIMKSGAPGMVVSVNRILGKPFKHAGGFQIHENLMAVGVEDNNRRKKSKVFIFNMENPERPPREPLAVIERFGTAGRGTAGCVGITTVGAQVLIVVGDWDTRHLDFYVTDREKLERGNAAIELEYTIDAVKADKSGWINEQWAAYQNTNFLKDHEGNLYLAGFGSDAEGNDLLDLFRVESPDLATFKIKKIYTKNFGKHPPTAFRFGAGMMQSHEKMAIFSCPAHITGTADIHVYR